MKIRRHSADYNFLGDTDTGTTFRWGRTAADDPPAAPWPELADISVSNRCSKACSFCYRDSRPEGGLMSPADYSRVLDELTDPRWGAPFQVALGGGEPLEHPGFLEILEETARRGIVPNFTTNGSLVTSGLAGRLAGKAGAAAVSVAGFSDADLSPARILAEAGLRVNLHFILDEASLSRAAAFLEGAFDAGLAGVNAVVFLTYKRSGRARDARGPRAGDALDAFLARADRPSTSVRFGFDACLVPALMRGTGIDQRLVDSCECAFFSVYVDERMTVKPCSFSPGADAAFGLGERGFKDIWEEGFEAYRASVRARDCGMDCGKKAHCRGSCPIHPELFLCGGREARP